MLCAAILCSCGDSEKMKKLELVNDSLAHEASAKDKIINDFFQNFNEIEDNLAIIKEKENIIRVNATGENISDDAKDRINDDIFEIYKIMLENKKKVKDLESQLSSAGVKAGEFKKTIDRLTSQIKEKNDAIEQLKSDLERANFNIENLNIRLNDLAANLDSVATADRQKKEVIAEQTTEINTAYYVFGSKKELKQHGITTKEGGFIGLGRISKLKQNFNKNYFTKIDLREVSEIEINSKNAKIITTHPASSYELVGGKKIEKIVIKDKKEFWSVSKYLVIVVD